MRILLTGTFDVDNYGDCLFPTIYEHELKKRNSSVEIDIASPTSRVSKIGCYKTVLGLQGRHEIIKDCKFDAVIIAGGNVLSSGHDAAGIYNKLPVNSLSSSLRIWMLPFLMKGKHPLTVCVNNPGVGPLSETAGRALNVCQKHADFFSVRDDFSALSIQKLGAVTCTGVDPAFLVKNLFSEEIWYKKAYSILPERLKPGNYLVAQINFRYLRGKSLNAWCYEVCKLAKYSELEILLLPICYHNSDVILLRRARDIFKKMGINIYLMDKYYKTLEIASIIGNSGAYCGSSLHGSITAAAFGRPLVVTCNHMTGKHTGVLNTIGYKGVTVNKFEDIMKAFDNSLKADKHAISQKGQVIATSIFDEIDKILHKTAKTADFKTEEKQILINAAEKDYEYYKNAKNRLVRLFMKPIRGVIAFNDIYNMLSFIKNEFIGSHKSTD